MNWFQAYPDRYDDELESLRQRGLQFAVDEDFKSAGRIRLTVNYPFNDRMIELEVVYPDVFPYFPPSVFAHNDKFIRHQHPNGGNLCLIGRHTLQWENGDTIGKLLEERAHVIFEYDDNHDEKFIRDHEEPQGEPVSEYLHGFVAHGNYALIDSDVIIPKEATRGTLKAISRRTLSAGGVQVTQLFITEIRSNDIDFKAEVPFPPFFEGTKTTIPWVRVDPAPSGSVEELMQRLKSGEFSKAGIVEPTIKRRQSHFAIVYPEEVTQGQYADVISVIELLLEGNPKNPKIRVNPIRTFRSGATDLGARMPTTKNLEQKSVTIFGLGALGSFVAVELARMGVGYVNLVDFDFVDPATVRRWVLGVTAFGDNKAHILAKFIHQEYPWTSPNPIEMKLGDVFQKQEPNQFAEVDELVSNSDLVIDCSAEVAASQLISDICLGRAVPYVGGVATPGAWGGIVFNWRPEKGQRCWMCMRKTLYPESDHLPPSDPEGELQPPGCPALTFTGTGFDLQEVALELARTCSGFLTSGTYPMPKWQLSTLALRDGRGERVLPNWTPVDIVPSAGCRCEAN